MEALLRAGLVAGSELVDVDRGAAIYSFHRARQQELQMSLCHPSGQASIHLVEAERGTVKLTAPLEHGRWEACGADDGCGSWSRHGSLLEVLLAWRTQANRVILAVPRHGAMSLNRLMHILPLVVIHLLLPAGLRSNSGRLLWADAGPVPPFVCRTYLYLFFVTIPSLVIFFLPWGHLKVLFLNLWTLNLESVFCRISVLFLHCGNISFNIFLR